MKTIQKLTLLFTLLLASNMVWAQCIETTVTLNDAGETEITICAGEDIIITAQTEPLGTRNLYILTNSNGEILDWNYNGAFDFSNSPPGTCRIYGVSWAGWVQDIIGENINTANITDFCWELSSNYVTVNRITPDAGNITFEDGGTDTTICVGDGEPDVLSFENDLGNPDFVYIITDEDGNVLAINTSGQMDFEGAGTGVCLVWGVSLSGELLLEPGDNIFQDELASECSGLTDHFLTVNRVTANGGEISVDGASEVEICVGDGIEDNISFDVTGNSGIFQLVVTDEDGNILALPPGNEVDFEGAGTGVCLVWSLSYTGDLLLMMGQNVFEVEAATSCFDYSDEPVRVVRVSAEPNEIFFEGGLTDTTICVGDGTSDSITLETTATGGSFVYIITDEDGNVLRINTSGVMDFEEIGEGVFLVYGADYSGNILIGPGDNIDDSPIADGCFIVSTNVLTVIGVEINGSTIMTAADSLMEIEVCLNDGTPDVVDFLVTGATGNTQLIVTDANSVVLALPPGNEVDFSGAGPGICLVWNLSYIGNLLIMEGDTIGGQALATECFDLSNNNVVVQRDEADAGMVWFNDSTRIKYTCPGDSIADLLNWFNTGNSTFSYAYLITNEDGVLLRINTTGEMDFEEAGEGVCLIYGLSYQGDLLAEVGDTVLAQALSTGCFELTDDPLTVVREEPNAGEIYFSADSSTTMEICISDAAGALVDITVESGYSGPGVIIITDEDGNVLNITQNTTIDFSQAGEGTCLIWHAAYTGTLTIEEGDNINGVDISDECFDVSEAIMIIRDDIDPGMVAAEGGLFEIIACEGDTSPVFLERTPGEGDNTIIIVTDENGVILDLGDIDEIDLRDYTGVITIYTFSYNGTLTFQIGDILDEAEFPSECYGLSMNNLIITLMEPVAGEVTTSTGASSVDLCLNSGNAVVGFITTGAVGGMSGYIITDANGVILDVTTSDSIDFSGAGAGLCRVYSATWLGMLNVVVGEHIDTAVVSDECFDISANHVEVHRTETMGGNITTDEGAIEIHVCPADSIPDEYTFIVFDSDGGEMQLVVTDENGVVLALPTGNMVDFEGAGEGICLVWNLTYTGDLLLQGGDTVGIDPPASNCYDFSDNSVTVIRETPEIGPFTINGEIALEINTGDTIPDIVNFEVTGSPELAYVVTDPTGSVIVILFDSIADFSELPEGEWLVYAIAYVGNIELSGGENLFEADIASGCAVISNVVEVTVMSEGIAPLVSVNSTKTEVQEVSINNPVKDVLLITTKSTIYNYELYDMQGRRVLMGKYNGIDGDRNIVFLDGIPSGIYSLVVKSEEAISRKSVIVQ